MSGRRKIVKQLDKKRPSDDRSSTQSGLAEPLLAMQLLRLTRWFDIGVSNLLRQAGHTGTTRSHALVMANLDDEGSSESELARRAGVSRQAIHQVVRDLSAKGMVDTRPDPGDRRRCLVVATELGRTISADADAALEYLESELARRIGADRVAALRAGLAVDPGPPLAAAEPRPRTAPSD